MASLTSWLQQCDIVTWALKSLGQYRSSQEGGRYISCGMSSGMSGTGDESYSISIIHPFRSGLPISTCLHVSSVQHDYWSSLPSYSSNLLPKASYYIMVGKDSDLNALVLWLPKTIIINQHKKKSTPSALVSSSSCNLGDPWRSACSAATQTA